MEWTGRRPVWRSEAHLKLHLCRDSESLENRCMLNVFEGRGYSSLSFPINFSKLEKMGQMVIRNGPKIIALSADFDTNIIGIQSQSRLKIPFLVTMLFAINAYSPIFSGERSGVLGS